MFTCDENKGVFVINTIANLFSALVDSFRPRMLALTLISVVVALVFWFVVTWLFIEPLVNFAVWLLLQLGLDVSSELTTTYTGLLGWLKFIFVPMIVFGLLWPLVATSAVLLAGLYVTPPVVNFLAEKEFQGIEKKGDTGIFMSLWVTVKSIFIFLIGWIVTLPLWLIPGMALVMPILLTAYLLMTVMRFDSLASYATKIEIKEIERREGSSSWLIALICAFLSFVPPVLVIVPVMSALAFTRHYMGILVQVRKDKIISL
jgi:hypothetical protein